MISMKIKGDKGLEKMLSRLGGKAPSIVGNALYVEGEDIMGDSKDNYVPVDLSTLKNSGHVNLPEIDGSKVLVRLGFGGAASAYALRQHETPDYHHTVGQWKYLETPALNAAAGMGKRLASRIRSSLIKEAR